ncbi:Flp family type IVb pilin [Sphingosinicellaceae bacterium]|nr:Flp family type IVb pilin [Sphingosinicellaceae bacterium]
MTKLLNLYCKLQANRSGASAAEYALMIALIGGVIVVAATALGNNMDAVFTTFAAKVKTPS